MDQDLVHVDAVLKMIAVMSGDDSYEKVVESYKAERKPRKLNDYVKKYREQRDVIGGVKLLRLRGESDDEIMASLKLAYGISEADAKSYIAMADEEMKGVTA